MIHRLTTHCNRIYAPSTSVDAHDCINFVDVDPLFELCAVANHSRVDVYTLQPAISDNERGSLPHMGSLQLGTTDTIAHVTAVSFCQKVETREMSERLLLVGTREHIIVCEVSVSS